MAKIEIFTITFCIILFIRQVMNETEIKRVRRILHETLTELARTYEGKVVTQVSSNVIKGKDLL